RGARMDDLYSATKGQVYQRSYQTGYNDAGWEIWPGNYSRFITQIDPENTSIGLFRIGGSITPDSPIYNRFARSFENSSGKNAMYFQLHEDLFDSTPETVTFIVTYLDKTNGSGWSLKYDAGDSELKEAYTITCNGSGTWKTQTVTVTDAVLNRNGPQEADFALINTDGKDDIFHMIQVEKGVASPIYKKSDDAFLQSISWPDIPDSLKSEEWNDLIIPGFKPEVFSYTIPLPYGFKQIPALTAKSQDNNAIFQTERATNLKGALDERTTSFTVTAENGMTKLTYKVIFEPENAISLNSQPFNAEPLFTRLVYREWFNNNYIEISNPGTDTIDLSNYLIAIGENKTPDQIIAETLTFDTRYKYYIPGCDYPISDSSSFISDIVEADPDVEARIEPNGSFVIGMIEREDLSDNIHIDDCDIIFNKDLYFETDVKLVIPGPNTIINDGWMTSSALCLYKILNDSVKNGSKAISDPDDFQLIDVFGTYDGSLWAPDGEVLLDEDNKWNLTRKPEFWLGDTLPGVEGSWGVNKIESEWICHSKDDYSALGLSGSESHLKLTENIGIHNFDPVTDYISTISSVIYEVSLGYQSPQFINGISLNTTYSEFQANIIKAHEDQELVLKGIDGGIKNLSDIIIEGDTLRVTSAYGNNITKYGLNTSSVSQSNDAVLNVKEGSGYNIDYADSIGTISGISSGISISAILENIIVPEKARLNVIDAENNLVPLLTLNSSGSYSPTTAGESIFFEVIAENNYTKISYQLKYLVNENEAYAWSDVFPVDQVLSIVSDIPGNINVNSLFANLRASTGASIKLIDRAGLERLQGSVDFEDQVVVTSVNGSINRVYKLNFEGEILGSDAYLTSDVYVVDQENFTIDSIIMDTSIDEFLDNVTAVPYAKITILNEDQSPATSGNLSNGFAVVVVSGDGLKEVTYTFNFYDPTLGINPEIESIKLYPNPLSDHLTIEGIAPQSTISIKNIYGNTLRTITNENSTSLELSTGDLLPGIYLIQIQSHNHYTFTHKIVKK
ncbi:MAG: T9SS type A sorting domain-containing protein, partial [Bacteroidales bacterium]|nr:T9SS type A sorting domain-containing protein [Bacteroidales bacterium]